MLITDPIDAGFESYTSVEEADDILASRGQDAKWKCLTTINKEIQLRLATEYADNRYGFIGNRASTVQPLEWPRTSISRYTSAEIPDILKKGDAVLAAESIDLELYSTVSLQTGAIKSTMDKLDVITTRVDYYQGGSSSGQVSFTEVNKILRSLTTTGLGRA